MARGNRCPHMGYSFRLAARVILYGHIPCLLKSISRGALAGRRNSSMGSP